LHFSWLTVNVWQFEAVLCGKLTRTSCVYAKQTRRLCIINYLKIKQLWQTKIIFLQDFINIIRKKRGEGLQVTGDGTNYAGQSWKVEDDLRLRELFLEGTSIPRLAHEFHRTQGSIRSRLNKLGLTE